MNNIVRESALLCDASFSAIPLLEALKAKGLYVAVCGSRPGDPGHAQADASFNFDYSDKKKLLQIVRKNSFDYLVPGCTDVSYSSCAWVARKLGLPGYDCEEVTQVINHKDAYRNIGKEKGYPIPKFETEVQNFGEIEFPALLKPMSSFSGRGIVRFDKYSHLKKFIDQGDFNGMRGNVLLEEFAEGQLYSHSAFLRSGKIAIDFFVNEYCTIHPYQVNSSYVSTKLSRVIQKRMRGWLEAFAGDLKLTDGLLHTQFISDGTSLYLVESCRRCPGDLYSLLIEKSTGINYSDLYVSSFIRSSYCLPKIVARKNYSRFTLSVSKEVIFMSAGMTLANAKVTFFPIKKTGELLAAAPMDRAGIFFVEHSSKNKMETLTENLGNIATIDSLNKCS